nr:unnamed protein product [Digitaria exilis]
MPPPNWPSSPTISPQTTETVRYVALVHWPARFHRSPTLQSACLLIEQLPSAAQHSSRVHPSTPNNQVDSWVSIAIAPDSPRLFPALGNKNPVPPPKNRRKKSKP